MTNVKDIIVSLFNPHPISGIGTAKLIINKAFYYAARIPLLRGKPKIELREILMSRPFKLTSYPFHSKALDAAVFFYDADSYFILFEGHEHFVSKYFAASQGDIVIDVGAHLGKYTIFFSRQVGRSGKVVAIEAHPKNFEYLLRNLRINSIRNVVPVNVAADEADGEVDLYETVESGWHSINLQPHQGKILKRRIIVPAKKLDTITKELHLPRIDFIKMDVEGGEYRVLKGAVKSLKTYKPRMMIEIHSKDTGTKVRQLLETVGYKTSVVYGNVEDGYYYLLAKKRQKE